MEHTTPKLIDLGEIITAYRLTNGELTQLHGFLREHSDLLVEHEPNKYDAGLIHKAVRIVLTSLRGRAG